MEIPNCRFCLEETNSRDNPLLAPCRCIGSIQFVHEQCLDKWRSVAPQSLINICQMCRVPYKILYIGFEVLPNEHGFIYQILICPYLFTFASKYLSFMLSGMLLEKYETSLQLIQYHQIAFHLTYFYLFYKKAFIQNRIHYRKQFFKGSRLGIIFLHIWFWYIAYSTENLLLLYLVDAFLPFYWHTHLQCLTEMNEARNA